MSETFDTNDRKGCKEQPCDDASRYGDGTLRLLVEILDKEINEAKAAYRLSIINSNEFAKAMSDYAWGLQMFRSRLIDRTKEKACSAGGTTPTSTPSP